MRLIYSRNRGRGGEYEYYKCYSRTARGRNCSRRYTPLDKIESGIERLYAVFRLPPAKAELIRSGVLDELVTAREEAAQEAERAKKRLRDVQEQQAKLLHAHYAGAVPLELMKTEMAWLTRDKADAERSLASTQNSMQKVEGTLDAALAIATRCDREYLTAEPAQRRMLNQGFFKKIYIDADGQVEWFELTEPFATLMDRSLLEQLRTARATSPRQDDATESQRAEGEAEEPSTLSKVIVNSFTLPSKTDQPDGGAVRLGWNVYGLVQHS